MTTDEILPHIGSLVRPKMIFGNEEDCLLVFNDKLETVEIIATNEVALVVSYDIGITTARYDPQWSMSYVKVLGPRSSIGYVLVAYLTPVDCV